MVACNIPLRLATLKMGVGLGMKLYDVIITQHGSQVSKLGKDIAIILVAVTMVKFNLELQCQSIQSAHAGGMV